MTGRTAGAKLVYLVEDTPLDTARAALTQELAPEARLPWHMPEIQHLLISQATGDFLKDTSYEDSLVKGAGYPPGS